MNLNGLILLVLASVGVLSIAALGVLANWFQRPVWLRRWHLIIGVAICAIILVAITVIGTRPKPGSSRSDAGTTGSNSSTPGRSARPTTVAQLAANLSDARLLTLDDSAGRPVLFASRLDGRDRTLMWDMPDNWPGTLVGNDAVILAAVWEERSRNRLELFSLSGEFRRALTEPPPMQADTSPSFAQGSGTIYFIRETWRDTGAGSSTLQSSRLMRLQLTGSQAEEVDTQGVQFRTVSVNHDGRLVAGQCATPEDGPIQGCLLDLKTGKVSPMPSLGPASMTDIAISGDGRWVAYSSPFTNPYGQSQVYVYDRQKDTTIRVTSLAGMNGEPAWAPNGTQPCLAFAHYERTKGSSVQLLCLTPEPVSVPAIAIGSWPVWLPFTP